MEEEWVKKEGELHRAQMEDAEEMRDMDQPQKQKKKKERHLHHK